jgi:hypothetical protein
MVATFRYFFSSTAWRPRPAIHCAPSVEKRKKLGAGSRSVVSCAAEEPLRKVTFGRVLA